MFEFSYMMKLLNTFLTIKFVEASQDKLVVVCDFVNNSSEAAYTVLNHLKKGRKTGHFTGQIKIPYYHKSHRHTPSCHI